MRIHLQQALIGLNSFLCFAFQLINQRQIHEDGLGFGIDFQCFAVALFGGKIQFALGAHPAQVVMAEK